MTRIDCGDMCQQTMRAVARYSTASMQHEISAIVVFTTGAGLLSRGRRLSSLSSSFQSSTRLAGTHSPRRHYTVTARDVLMSIGRGFATSTPRRVQIRCVRIDARHVTDYRRHRGSTFVVWASGTWPSMSSARGRDGYGAWTSRQRASFVV